MIDKGMLVQNCVDLVKVVPVPGLCSETCPTSSDSGNLVVNIKVEDVTDIFVEEDDPMLIKFPGIKAEH